MKKLAIFLTFLIILMISFNSYAADDENPFTDVQEGSNYYKEVLWAVNTDPQIVQGITKDKFKPFTTCNRAQMVTFLWRMKGCPEPETTKNPFKDVKTTDLFSGLLRIVLPPVRLRISLLHLIHVQERSLLHFSGEWKMSRK